MQSTPAGPSPRRDPSIEDPFDVPPAYNAQGTGQSEAQAYSAIRSSLDQLLNYVHSMQQNYPGAANDINIVLRHLMDARQAIDQGSVVPGAMSRTQPVDPLRGM